MESLRANDIADRDQLWASLRALREKIEQLAKGGQVFDGRQQQFVELLARILLAELNYREQEATDL